MRNCSIVILFLILMFSCSSKNELKEQSFYDFDGNRVELFRDNVKLNVFFFLAPECPLSQNYTKEIQEYFKLYNQREVDFFLVFSGEVYSDDEVKSYLQDYDLKISSIRDVDYVLAKHYGAKITPEVFLVDKDANVVYNGKIDNWIESLGVKRQVVTEFYLKNAIESILSGKEVEIETVEAVGCMLE